MTHCRAPGGYPAPEGPARPGGPWLCKTFVLSLFHAVVVQPVSFFGNVTAWSSRGPQSSARGLDGCVAGDGQVGRDPLDQLFALLLLIRGQFAGPEALRPFQPVLGDPLVIVH